MAPLHYSICEVFVHVCRLVNNINEVKAYKTHFMVQGGKSNAIICVSILSLPCSLSSLSLSLLPPLSLSVMQLWMIHLSLVQPVQGNMVCIYHLTRKLCCLSSINASMSGPLTYRESTTNQR